MRPRSSGRSAPGGRNVQAVSRGCCAPAHRPGCPLTRGARVHRPRGAPTRPERPLPEVGRASVTITRAPQLPQHPASRLLTLSSGRWGGSGCGALGASSVPARLIKTIRSSDRQEPHGEQPQLSLHLTDEETEAHGCQGTRLTLHTAGRGASPGQYGAPAGSLFTRTHPPLRLRLPSRHESRTSPGSSGCTVTQV